MTRNGKTRWSARTQWDMAETPWARELARLRAGRTQLWDLTASNPTTCGFRYDPVTTLLPLQDAAALQYNPDPRGLRGAREAVSLYYRDHGAVVDPQHIYLTTSTSEAYSFLFRLLCDPGDEILIGQPGYPLFDFLAQLDDVRLVSYDFFYDHGWHIDIETIRRRLTPKSRAIVVVHPNNPTGHFTRRADRTTLENLCMEYGLALIVDEVFLDYTLPGQEKGESFATGTHPVPTFVLSGLSKVAALPQMKASWIACFGVECPGEPAVASDALDRLEVIADTFLSMNAPVQCALPVWLRFRTALQSQIIRRTHANLITLDAVLERQTLVTRLQVEAGWYAVLRIPSLQSQEQTALDLLGKKVVVHPGGFFGFSGHGWLVVSLLSPEAEFRSGAEALLGHF